MERSVWTDERIDDMVDRIEKRFDHVETELRSIHSEIAELRRDMHNQFVVTATMFLTLAGIMVAHSLL